MRRLNFSWIIKNKNNNLVVIFVLPVLIFIDQLAKNLIRHYDGFYICNKGVAFGIAINNMLFWLIWGIIFSVLFYYFLKNNFYKFPLILIIAGALANIIDRMQFGCVIDFINIKIFNYPLFNLADTFILIGVILVIVQSFKNKK